MKPRPDPAPPRHPAAANEHRVIEVAAGLVFRDGKLLITRRHADAHLGGLWEFPGGKREPGETFKQCLSRELREELGCEVEVGDRLETLRHDYPDKAVRIEFFACRLRRGEPQALGCAAARWVAREELDRFSFPAADARLLERVRGDETLWR